MICHYAMPPIGIILALEPERRDLTPGVKMEVVENG
jgi:hypothetical protein